jgi:hypothetical protein
MLMKAWIVVAAAACMILPARSHAQAATTELYRGVHGMWTVLCMQDLVDKHRECGLFAKAPGRNPLTETELMLFLGARDWKIPPSISLKEPVLPLRRLIFEVDDGNATSIECPEARNSTCTIDGDQSNRLIQSWQNARRLLIRLTGFDGAAYDFSYDMREFTPALLDFIRQLQKFD